MDIDKYVHIRDVFYVTGALHRMSLALRPPYKTHTYDLSNYRSFKAPTYRDQRKIIKGLEESNTIILTGAYNRYGKPTVLSKAVRFNFKRTPKDTLKRAFDHFQPLQ